MPALSIYSNVENTALVILSSKGFKVWRDASSKLLMAERDGWDFCGESAVELLAAVSIYEYHSPTQYKNYWWKIDEPNLLEQISESAPQYTSVIHRGKA